MIERILLCSDGSKDAIRAAQAAADLARHFGAQLIVLHVFEPTGQDPVSSEPISEDAQNALVQRTMEAVKGTGALDRRAFGHAAEEIVQAAEDEKADLVVVGAHGKSAIERFFVGSVSDRVMRHAPCSVLVIR